MATAPLVSVQDLAKIFGTKVLFEGITVAVSEGERIALIGPNGSGKSTLLRMFAGLEEFDRGNVRPRRDLHLSYVAQEDVFESDKTVEDILTETLIASGCRDDEIHGKVSVALSKAGFSDYSIKASSLSGGWRKRLSIVRGLITNPELLLVDEPTNHLDISGILWLEELIERANFALVFVSHDRYFIEKLARRVVEINRKYPQGFLSIDGDYADFMEAREGYLAGLKQTRDSLANKVRREVEWLRQGAKARTTKSKHRIEEAHKLEGALGKFKLEDTRATLSFSASDRKTRELIKAESIGKSLGGKQLFSDLDLVLAPGSRLGIVGGNGSGKTTLVRTLLGELQPDTGRVIRASNLKYAFFDQARKQLDPSLTLKRALVKEGDGVVFNGRPLHVTGWAKRFLFSADQLSTKVAELSGGEQARLLLAKIMLEEADILLFDEPTNDLDIDTLEVLEESFSEFPGAIVLVTHDRYFLDRVTNVLIGIGNGKAARFGSYAQWEASKERFLGTESPEDEVAPVQKKNLTAPKQKLRMSFKEQQDLSTIEEKILKEETKLSSLQDDINNPDKAHDHVFLIECAKSLQAQREAVEKLYARWHELEEKKKAIDLGE